MSLEVGFPEGKYGSFAPLKRRGLVTVLTNSVTRELDVKVCMYVPRAVIADIVASIWFKGKVGT